MVEHQLTVPLGIDLTTIMLLTDQVRHRYEGEARDQVDKVVE